MQPDIAHKLPIGWYLKEADSLITAFTNAAFETHGINRFHWQVLKSIDKHGKISKQLYYHLVDKFLTVEALDEVMAALVAREWLQPAEDLYMFTEKGKTAYAEIAALQEENRKKVLEGTTVEEYLATIRFLETMITNMGGKI
ncbi:MarR family winged helix-turn-helix transcriptional regulator [Chitinophaga eiseniae]|uniref:DNA-binding transcriptional regulator, MarR family n=1 Tax=Chitinophaga eiseniae TaxID=634771 RepID=A0A847SM27_9BACT|nr:hypothetical protein [Chitinophaga eiseniae]NLR80823.1 hypothetical protein [Chitinophaga eiseniae]